MHKTLVVHNRYAWRCHRTRAALDAAQGILLLTIDQLAARLAGGFVRPVDSDALKVAVGAAVMQQLGELDAIKQLPGFQRAAANTLAKAWTSGLSLGDESRVLRPMPKRKCGLLPLPYLKERCLLNCRRISFGQETLSRRRRSEFPTPEQSLAESRFMGLLKCRPCGDHCYPCSRNTPKSPGWPRRDTYPIGLQQPVSKWKKARLRDRSPALFRVRARIMKYWKRCVGHAGILLKEHLHKKSRLPLRRLTIGTITFWRWPNRRIFHFISFTDAPPFQLLKVNWPPHLPRFCYAVFRADGSFASSPLSGRKRRTSSLYLVTGGGRCPMTPLYSIRRVGNVRSRC